jgi:hypothetical protein
VTTCMRLRSASSTHDGSSAKAMRLSAST